MLYAFQLNCFLSNYRLNFLFELSQLMLTFPSNTASAERNISALKRVNTYLRATQTHD